MLLRNIHTRCTHIHILAAGAGNMQATVDVVISEKTIKYRKKCGSGGNVSGACCEENNKQFTEKIASVCVCTCLITNTKFLAPANGVLAIKRSHH